jgi:hypothetical protein
MSSHDRTRRIPNRFTSYRAPSSPVQAGGICHSPTNSWQGCTGGRATSTLPTWWQSASSGPGELTFEDGATGQGVYGARRYATDLLLPVANFKQRDAFIASEWAVWFSCGFVFAGWLLAAVVVAGLSGVFKRD